MNQVLGEITDTVCNLRLSRLEDIPFAVLRSLGALRRGLG